MFPLLAACGELPQEGERELEFPTRFHERLAGAMYGEGKKSRRQGETRPQESDKGRQDPGEGGHTIDLKGHKRGTRGDKGRQDPGEGGHTIHIKGYKRRQGETRFQLSR